MAGHAQLKFVITEYSKTQICLTGLRWSLQVGGAVMFENHQKLKEARTGARKLEQDFKNIGDRLEQEKQKNSRIEQDVRNYEEREKTLCKIKTLQMKRAWAVSTFMFLHLLMSCAHFRFFWLYKFSYKLHLSDSNLVLCYWKVFSIIWRREGDFLINIKECWND